MNNKKKYTLSALLLSIVIGCTSCSSSSEGTTANTDDDYTYLIELQQNDYRGGYTRTQALKNGIIALMNSMKRNNIAIREDNPNTYWTTNGYQDFVSSFLVVPIINDTQFLNEEESDWETATEATFCNNNSFTVSDDEGGYRKASDSIEIKRNEKDDYAITGTDDTLPNTTLKGESEYRILYDCDKDWCKAYEQLYISGSPSPAVTAQLFEYARINKDTFAIQTTNERLVVILEPSETDIDLRERPIKEFYYSRLSGGCRTKFVPREDLPIIDEETGKEIRDNVQTNNKWAQYPILNENGDVAHLYGKNDSLFLQEDVNKTGYEWVFEDGALQQAIVYKDQTLVATTYNKLSEKYERFIYSVEQAKPELIAEIEKMVNIEGLVGVVEVSKSEIKPATEENTEATEGEVTDDNGKKVVNSLEEAFSQIASEILSEESDEAEEGDTAETTASSDSSDETTAVTTTSAAITTSAEANETPSESSVTSASISEEAAETTSNATTSTVEGG